MESIDFIDNKYIPCEKIFPCWITCRIILTDFCHNTKRWKIEKELLSLHILSISLEYPMMKDEISGKQVPQVLSFPLEDREKVIKICNKLHKDYCPQSIEKYIGTLLNSDTIWRIKNEIYGREQSIIYYGGRNVLDELKFRLGVLF